MRCHLMARLDCSLAARRVRRGREARNVIFAARTTPTQPNSSLSVCTLIRSGCSASAFYGVHTLTKLGRCDYSCPYHTGKSDSNMSFVKWKSGGSSGGGSGPAAAASLAGHPDFTRSHLRDREMYRLGHLRSLGLQGEVTALAVDPVYSLMAVGTSTGLIHLLGKASFQCMIQLSTLRDHKPAAVTFLTFVPGAGRLCCIDEKNTLHVWNTGPGGMDDAKNQPSKEVTTRYDCDTDNGSLPGCAEPRYFREQPVWRGDLRRCPIPGPFARECNESRPKMIHSLTCIIAT